MPKFPKPHPVESPTPLYHRALADPLLTREIEAVAALLGYLVL